MAISMQVIYPTEGGTTFDHDYYLATHMPLVMQHMGEHIASASVSKGLSGPGPDAPSPAHVIATILFEDQAALQAAMGVAGPVIADLPNFYSGDAQIMIGEVLG